MKPSIRTVKTQLDLAESYCSHRRTRLTPIRRQVLSLLLGYNRCVRAYELLEDLKETHANATPPTIYRALEFLISEGLAHRVDSVNAYIACADPVSGPHNLIAICTDCNAAAEINDDKIINVLIHCLRRIKFEPTGNAIEIQALCGPCREKYKKSAAGRYN